MHPTDQKFTEFFTLSLTKETFAAFPSGIIKAAESPDFLIEITPRKKVGIEVTRIMHRTSAGLALGEEGLQQLFLEQVKRSVKVVWRGGVWIRLQFGKHYRLTPENFLSNTTAAASAIRRSAAYLKGRMSTVALNQDQLPPSLSSVWMGQFSGASGEVWELEHEPLPLMSFCDLVAQRIASKEEKTSIYMRKRLHQLWLLLYAGVVPEGAIERLASSQTETSQLWHRILLLDLKRGKVVTLLG